MTSLMSEDLIKTCKAKLLERKTELLNQMRSTATDFQTLGSKSAGDEVDQSSQLLAEHTMLVNADRARTQLLEIEQALGRIEQGTFGICEETEEEIETERLLAIPWTKLSIEGAEMREALQKRFART